MQRYRSLAVHKEFEPISPKRSLPLSVQFCDFFAAKTPKRSFGGDNQFLSVAVSTAAIPVLEFCDLPAP